MIRFLNIREKINKKISGGFFGSVLKVGSGNLIGQLIGVITTPILSRIYPELAYAEQAIITSTAAIAVNLVSFGLSAAIMRPKDSEESKRIVTAVSFITVGLTTGLFLFCLILQNSFKIFSVSGSYFVALFLSWLYIITTNLQSYVRMYVNRKGDYNKLFFNPIIGAIANIVIAIPLGLIGCGFQGFLITTIVSHTVSILHMCKGDIPYFHNFRPKDIVLVFKENCDYVLYQFPAGFINNTATEYPTQFLGRMFSVGALADYSMCLRILKYPIRLIAAPISTVYFKAATEYHREGKNLAEFTYKMINRILIISFLPVALCCWFSNNIFGFVLGDTWASAGDVAAILAAQYVMLFCTDCVSYCRVAIGRQKVNLIYSLLRFLVTAVFSIVGFALFHSLKATLFALSFGSSLVYIFDMALNFYFLDKSLLKRYLLVSLTYVIVLDCIVLYKVQTGF